MTKQKDKPLGQNDAVISQDDADMRGVMPAMRRAAKRAHEIARQAGTGIVISRDGKVVIIDPQPERFE